MRCTRAHADTLGQGVKPGLDMPGEVAAEALAGKLLAGPLGERLAADDPTGSSARKGPRGRDRCLPGARQNESAPEGAPSLKPSGGAGAFSDPMRNYSLLSAIIVRA